jgi:hypothetical protein
MLASCAFKKTVFISFGMLSIGFLIWTAGGPTRAQVLGLIQTQAAQSEGGVGFPQPPGSRFPDAEHFFLTDQGSHLPVFNWLVPPEEYDAFARKSDKSFRERYTLTSTSPPTAQSNCHGWVFLQGKFLIFAEQVERILRENGYRPVAEPKVGDVIIYRDPSGTILHSGLVWWVGSEGQTLIHSKFGVSGRYLHSPIEQPYGERFSYYRADRRRHAVRLRSAETAVQP